MKRYLLFLLCLFSVSNPITSFAKTPGDEQVAITIAGEAWGEGRLGMYAVACVIQNRAKRSHLSPYEITRHGLYGKGNKMAKKGFLAHKKWLLKLVALLNRLELKDITHGATHFENVEVFGYPNWANGMIITCKIGQHTFFRERR